MHSVKGKLLIALCALSFTIALPVSLVFAMDSHDAASHAAMNHAAESHSNDHSAQHTEGVMGKGVIHKISKLNRTVNITHEPIPALNWPEMTMDLPVADSVDLSSLQSGDHVSFHLKLDADKRYVITQIMK